MDRGGISMSSSRSLISTLPWFVVLMRDLLDLRWYHESWAIGSGAGPGRRLETRHARPMCASIALGFSRATCPAMREAPQRAKPVEDDIMKSPAPPAPDESGDDPAASHASDVAPGDDGGIPA